MRKGMVTKDVQSKETTKKNYFIAVIWVSLSAAAVFLFQEQFLFINEQKISVAFHSAYFNGNRT